MNVKESKTRKDRIVLTAEEIAQLVEDQLAWLAVASYDLPKGSHYFMSDFRFAESIVSLGRNAAAVIDCAGADTYDNSEFAEESERNRAEANIADWQLMGELFPKILPVLGERLRHCIIKQIEPGQTTLTWCGDAKGLSERDYVFDYERGMAIAELRDVVYSMQSVAMRPKAETDILLRGKKTFGMRCVTFQNVVAFRDGRSVCQHTDLALNPSNVLVNPHSGRRLSYVMSASDDPSIDAMSEERKETVSLFENRRVHYFQDVMHEFAVDQFALVDRWRVEVALSKKRTGIGLPTDANGIRALIRAVDEARTTRERRRVLIHWVQGHWRRNRRGGESWVREHLRGTTDITAGGLHFHVKPSRSDLQRACNGARFDKADAG